MAKVFYESLAERSWQTSPDCSGYAARSAGNEA